MNIKYLIVVNDLLTELSMTNLKFTSRFDVIGLTATTIVESVKKNQPYFFIYNIHVVLHLEIQFIFKVLMIVNITCGRIYGTQCT